MGFTKGKRKPLHTNTEDVLSEQALNDSLRAAQVIFQRHSQDTSALSSSPRSSMSVSSRRLVPPVAEETKAQRPKVRRSNSSRTSSNKVRQTAPAQKISSAPAKHPTKPPAQPRDVVEQQPAQRRSPMTAHDAAHIAAMLAHSHLADAEVDKMSDRTMMDDDSIHRSTPRSEQRQDAAPPSAAPSPMQTRMEPKQYHNLDMNRRRMEIPQPVKRERIRPIPLLQEMEQQQAAPIEEQVPQLRPEPVERTSSEPLTTQNSVSGDPQDEFIDVDNQSFISEQGLNRSMNHDAEVAAQDNSPNFSIGTNILPKKKTSSNRNPLKKIFGKPNAPGPTYNTTSRNFDPLLASNTQMVQESVNKSPVLASTGAQKAMIYTTINRNTSATSLNAPSASATPMKFKKTMRYDNRKKQFNEDKPWKSHKDAKYMTDIERKRYEGMWVSNRFRYLNLLYWWPVDAIAEETKEPVEEQAPEQDSEAESPHLEAVASNGTTSEKSHDMDNGTSFGTDLSMADKSSSTVDLAHSTTDSTYEDARDDEDSPESVYYSDVDNENTPQVNDSISTLSTKIEDNNYNKSRESIPSVGPEDGIIRTSSPAPSEVPHMQFLPNDGSEGSIPPAQPQRPPHIPTPDYSEMLLTLPPDGLILNLVVKDIWQRSNLPDDLLRQIYSLVNTRGDGTLDRRSFIIGMWLVDQCLYGKKLPTELGSAIWNSVDGNVLSSIQPKAEQTVKIKRKSKRNIVGRELKNIKKGIRHVHLGGTKL
ncbi:hypothetical protein DAKH74_048160 [Maudiozyma humilis]|uniref:EH domain-containing protein n=1 Tax=Maudiozyma humilis TaxID=51915 RepID=A0AAV5S3B5_MAUHU|nr:hypothetical protein DAKH74_048160 [Kazachstania humilis]